ncbi:hypothetical protein ACPPVT_07465 [Angustibacter sp. McL0619]|uniref:hypothetical protein n=1 Tax=Angustibacter sp. McL0619 TaxID=3415676 RepID=UPI003CF1E75B
MPVLATIVTLPDNRSIIVPDTRRLEFESLDGTSLIDWAGDEFIALNGITGIDVPPRDVIRRQLPGLPGSRIDEIRDLERQVFIPVHTRPADRDWRTHLKQLASVRSFLNYRDRDYVAAEGTFDLVGYGDGTRRVLRCTYLSGMEGDYGSDQMFGWWRADGVTLLAVDPYCRGSEWSTPVVQLPIVAPFLSNDPADGFPRAITASVALGANMPVIIGGDVPTPGTVELIGPADSTHITSPAGLDVTLDAIDTGDLLVLQTGRTKSLTLNGVRADELLIGDSPQWAPFQPGATTVSIVMTGASSDTRARVYGTELFETLWG